MRMAAAIIALFGGFGAAGPSRADDECWVPMAQWQPREAVERMAGEQGWTVRRIRIDDGCYEVEGVDVEGRAVEITVDPATLAVLEMEQDEDDDRREGGAERPSGDRHPED